MFLLYHPPAYLKSPCTYGKIAIEETKGAVHLLKKLALFFVIVLLLGATGKIFLTDSGPKDTFLPDAKNDSFFAALFSGKGKSDPAASSGAEPSEPEPEPPAPHPADALLETMPLEQKVGQLFFARCPDEGAAHEISSLHPAGYILFARDFEGETPDSVRDTIAGYQNAASIPMLIGVDEEGGTVVRISKYRAFRRWSFQSPQELYEEGGNDAFVYDTAEKDALLQGLGINVNLAPVCDVVTNRGDYMYRRALGQDAEATADYVRTVVTQMKKDGIGAVLKHFPGYGPNGDTHEGRMTDSRSMQTYQNSDFLPFQAGIEAGAGGVLMHHITVECMDGSAPASLSPRVHEILREELGFSGVIMTDDLAMGALSGITDAGEAAVRAVQAGNDLILSSDLAAQHAAVLNAVDAGTISEEEIDEHLRRVLDWKVSLGLMTYDGLTAAPEEDAA